MDHIKDTVLLSEYKINSARLSTVNKEIEASTGAEHLRQQLEKMQLLIRQCHLLQIILNQQSETAFSEAA